MKTILCFAFVVLAIANVQAETAAESPCHHPDYPNLVLGKNSFVGKLCGYVECTAGGIVLVHRCPAILVAAGSIIVPEDLSKPHPECCEHAIKPDSAAKQ